MAADQLGFLHITIIIKRITMTFQETAIRAARAVVAHSAKLSFHLGKRSVQFTEDRSFLANFSRAKLSCLSALTILALVPAASSRAGELSPAAQLPPIAEQMAKTYGLDSFGQVEGIRYTFNVELPGLKRSDTWEWRPKTDTVSFQGKDKEGKPIKATYNRSELSSQSDAVKNEIDPAFINDQYWLLFPLHVAWDGAKVTDEGMHKLPLGKGSAELVVVKYSSD